LQIQIFCCKILETKIRARLSQCLMLANNLPMREETGMFDVSKQFTHERGGWNV